MTQPNLPNSDSSTFSSTSHPSARSAAKSACKSSTRSFIAGIVAGPLGVALESNTRSCSLPVSKHTTLARQPAQRIDLDTVSAVLAGLETITGQPVPISDLIKEMDTASPNSNPKLAALLKTAKPALKLETMRGPKLSSKEHALAESYNPFTKIVIKVSEPGMVTFGYRVLDRYAVEGEVVLTRR
jgi:hypothetical protein